MPDVLYFAYGSNLLRERLIARCPGLSFVGHATLPSHRIAFDKVSDDKSGKCTFEPVGADEVLGVLWKVPAVDLAALDDAEGVGHGYESCQIVVRHEDNECEALTYRATRRQAGLQPYDWYLALVLAGASQQGLPQRYVERLRATPFRQDLNLTRKRGKEALAALAAADLLHVLDALNDSAAQPR